MTFIYCSQNHANASENRFCAACGERLVQSSLPNQSPVLAGRYRIRHELGQGGFGRTYLAEDINRFHELCVLKEFVPHVQGNAALQKAEELFEREAGILYQLQHPQIPRFRELFRARFDDQERLFLVQDYVEGRSYRELLEARIRVPTANPPYFSETEIRLLFAQILPVLRYIHGAGVIHRDLSPDNLIMRSSDQLPVLIDFGGVKQIAATATSQYTAEYTPNAETLVPTRLGQQGYAPPEQMQQGQLSPQSDLYALAVIALVLLTGKRSLDLVDPEGQSHPWQPQIGLSPELTALLTRMLSFQPANRFPSAEDVLLALERLPLATQSGSTQSGSTQPTATQSTTTPTVPVSPVYNNPAYNSPAYNNPTHTAPVYATPDRTAPIKRRFLWLLLLPLLMLPAVAYGLRDRWLPLLPAISTAPDSTPSPSSASSPASSPISTPSTPLSPLEQRAQAAEIDYGFLIKLTDASFVRRYPKQAGRILSDRPEDAKWRQKWTDLADEWLTTLSQVVSSESRQKLGQYGEADRSQWKQSINQLYVGSRSLYDLSDAQFVQHFPAWNDNLHEPDFLTQPVGQVWQAIAADQIQALTSGKALENIEFAPGAFSHQTDGTLAAGEGKVYTANLATGQILRLNLQAPHKSSLLSIYLPRPTSELPMLLEDSTEVTWVGKLPQSGYYEVVIVNKVDQPIQYQLTLAVDNVTSTPVKPDQAEAPEAKD